MLHGIKNFSASFKLQSTNHFNCSPQIISYHLPVVSNESSQHRRRLVQSIKPNASNKMSQSIQTSYPSTLSLLSKPSEHPEEPTVSQSFWIYNMSVKSKPTTAFVIAS